MMGGCAACSLLKALVAASDGMWTQVGDAIDGEAAHDQFGSSVSMSSDETRSAMMLATTTIPAPTPGTCSCITSNHHHLPPTANTTLPPPLPTPVSPKELVLDDDDHAAGLTRILVVLVAEDTNQSTCETIDNAIEFVKYCVRELTADSENVDIWSSVNTHSLTPGLRQS